MFKRILVPTDFSRPSDAALAYARRLAEGMGASLHVLHVVDNMFLRAVLRDPRDHEADALRQMRDRVPPDDGGTTALLSVERSDEPAERITAYARIHHIDLIVMGTHGRGRVAHLLLGSVAETVARNAPCPVLTMRDAPPLASLGGLRILVPTDFSPSSDEALGCARRLAATLGGSIRLLHVVEHPAITAAFGSAPYVPEPTDMRPQQVDETRIQLARRMLGDSRSRVAITSDVVLGPAAMMISAYAGDSGFDLIVMGTRGRGGLTHLLMGSIAESVIRTAGSPVLTVKPVEGSRVLATAVEAAPVAV